MPLRSLRAVWTLLLCGLGGPVEGFALIGRGAPLCTRAARSCAAAAAAAASATRSGLPAASAPAAPRQIVVTDMDETLIRNKSTGYVIAFLLHCRCYLRLIFSLPLALFLIPLSKVSRSGAVRVMYWLAFRGLRVEKAERVAAGRLTERYARDLQDPAASAILAADAAVVITASPEFMARPWLEKYLGVPAANVYGAVLEVVNGRFTGRTGDLPIGQKKVDLMLSNTDCVADGAVTTGYGDHPTDVPFLEACSRGVLVHQLPAEQSGACVFEPAMPFDVSKLGLEPLEPTARAAVGVEKA